MEDLFLDLIKPTKSNLVKLYLATALFFGATFYGTYMIENKFSLSNQRNKYVHKRDLIKSTLSPSYCSDFWEGHHLKGYNLNYSLRDLADPNIQKEIDKAKELIKREKTLESKIDSLESLPEFKKEKNKSFYSKIFLIGSILCAGGLGSLTLVNQVIYSIKKKIP